MAIDPNTIVPDLAEIGARIKAYTVDSNGRMLGTFTDDTQPTAAEVAEEAIRAARHVALRLGEPSVSWTSELAAAARDAAAARAALLIATGEYGGATNPDEVRIDQLGRIAREELSALIAIVKDNRPGGRRFHSIRQRA